METIPAHLRPFLKASAYPHPAGGVKLIQTHISWVFLAGDYAYKFKKPLNLGFLDFSTLERRKFFCEQEFEMNQRFSPEVYLEVLPLYRKGDATSFDASGTIIDYCLKMRRFPQSSLLDRQLKSGTFNPVWVDELAAAISTTHANSTVDLRIDHTSLLQEHIAASLTAASQHPESIKEKAYKALTLFAERALLKLRPQLQLRQAEGYIRPCHGDLHMRNITLIDGHPKPFDCIEFNSNISTIDTMNDIAFLIMDCDAHKRPDLGMRFLSRYLELSGDYGGLELLPLYLFYRATVRGKVACILADELKGAPRQIQLDEASKQFGLALQYTMPSTAALFVISGLSGSGKSHLALMGCGIERAIIIRSDAIRKQIAPLHSELDLYGKEMHILTYETMFKAAKSAISAGFSVILDATFIHPDSRQQAKTLAEESDVPLHFFWLDIEENELKRRVVTRQHAADDISDADLHVLDLQLAEYRIPTEPWVQFVDSSNTWPHQSQQKG